MVNSPTALVEKWSSPAGLEPPPAEPNLVASAPVDHSPVECYPQPIVDDLMNLDDVSLVRRILAVCEDRELREIGLVGEIQFVVRERITEQELDLLRLLQGSRSSDERTRLLESQRSALSPFVGQYLLKAGINQGRSRVQVHINETDGQIVFVSGLPQAGELPSGLTSCLQRAEWILAQPGPDSWARGERAAKVLLDGRDPEELDGDELGLLAKAYNWAGWNGQALEVMKRAILQFGATTERLDRAAIYLRNEHGAELGRFLTECDACIAAAIGSPGFWHLCKADRLLAIATGESEIEDYEWNPGDRLRHAEFLPLAEAEVRAAIECDENVRSSWQAGELRNRFAPLFSESDDE